MANDTGLTLLLVDPRKRQPASVFPGLSLPVGVVSGVEEAASYPADVLLAGGSSAEETASLVRALRRTPGLRFKPLFTVSSDLAPAVAAVVDGVVGDWNTLCQHSRSVCDLEKNHPAAAGDSQLTEDEVLLRFLFSRPDFRVTPVPAYDSPQIYSYPLLECFAETPDQVGLWVQSLTRRHLLQETRLVDRIRLCPACRWSHLSYVDQCPNCSGIDIHEQAFLHCFVCGNVSPQDKYMKSGGLVCPKCNAALRHIGVDYDRAMENFHCHACNFVFADPEIFAKCLHCGKSSATDHLDILNVHELALSERGRLSIRAGRLNDVYAVLDEMNYVSLEYFTYTLNWLMRQGERYNNQLFSLLLITLENVDEVSLRLGRGKTLLLIEAFAVRLRSIIRSTDLSVRMAQNSVLLMLPQTPRAGADVLSSRLMQLQEDTRQNGGLSLRVRVARYTYPDERADNESAGAVLARLGEAFSAEGAGG